MKRFLSVALSLFALASAFGEERGPAPSRPEEPSFLVLVPISTSSIPMLVVERLDREHNAVPGASIRVDFFSSNPQALARLLLGEAGALLTGTSQGWENHLDGGPVVILNTGVWGVSSMISREPGIQKPGDLAGRRVAMPFPGAPLDVQMRHIWRETGLDPDRDVDLSYSAPAQSAGFLLAGRIDSAPLPEPLATNLVMNRGLYRSFEIADAWAEVTGGDPASPQVSLFTTSASLAAQSALYATLVEAWREASLLVTEAPEVYGEMFAARLELPAAVVTEALKRTILSVPTAEIDEAEVRDYFAVVRSVYPEERPGLSESFFAGTD